ncbi:hypothetical protein D9M73_219140 [compost metagenome]
MHPPGKIARGHGFGERTNQPDHFGVFRVKWPFDSDLQLPRQLHIVAHVRVHVQGQVERQQAYIVIQQGLQATLANAGDARVLALPEITMVHQHQIGLGLDGGIQQCLAGGNTTDNTADLRPAFDLQAIWAIILDLRAAQVTLGFLDQGV